MKVSECMTWDVLIADPDRILKVLGVAAPGLIAAQLFPSP